ncbi:hypothetical protein FRX31_025728 [Thalictrum thalictroides]|uniref:Uncharacterized protein n=1 Tax=Thalictrum thalictroides TaxID=46969 RepID=A0A7J6VHU7_THATH|nr:hypothetical protein FRX31_025728 [Thalictrum thalictroides]
MQVGTITTGSIVSNTDRALKDNMAGYGVKFKNHESQVQLEYRSSTKGNLKGKSDSNQAVDIISGNRKGWRETKYDG